MADIVNLRRARKAKARRTAETEAEANRLVARRSNAERLTNALEHNRSRRHLDGHRRLSQPGEESVPDDDT
ncbi:MAG TPA: DUF4169 family protein [Beijerinckiaceae bacterium]|jgi:hypothetical protein|nr:DUF4169 family protein [Beijerinckiaceae bacterium]